MSDTHDVLVLGVGGMGAAALAHLAARGVRAIGLEQDDVPSLRGSSVGHTRIIRKAYFEEPRYVPLLARAYELWDDLGADLLVRTGCLNLGPADHADIAGVLASVTQHRLPHARLDRAAVTERFPIFHPAPNDIGVYEEDAGYLRVEACTEANARRALATGASLRTRTTVRALTITPRAVHAELASGESITAASLVVSAGAWLASPVLAEVAAGLPPLVVTRQVQLWFAAANDALARPPRMPAFLHFVGDRAFYGVPLAAGSPGAKVCRHFGGATTTADALDRTLHAEDSHEVRGYVGRHLPILDGAPVDAKVCMYTSTPDRHFVVGRHPRWPHVVVLGGFSGHGYKLASVIGEIAAELVVDGRSRHDIALFDPARAIS